jgi:hypothetical protein
VTLAWDVLERAVWDESSSAASYASLLLQLRISPPATSADRDKVISELVSLSTTPHQRANVASLCMRQWCLSNLPSEYLVALAQVLLVEPNFCQLGGEIFGGTSGNPLAKVGNLVPWRLFMLAGRSAIPQLGQDLFDDSPQIRAGAKLCLEQMLLIRLKDEGYDANASLESLLPLKRDVMAVLERYAR